MDKSETLYTSIVDQRIDSSELGLDLAERSIDRVVVLDVDLEWE